MQFVPLSEVPAEDLLKVGYRVSATLDGKIIPASMASSSQSARNNDYQKDAWEAFLENDDQMTVVSDPEEIEYIKKACYCCLCGAFMGDDASSQICGMGSRQAYSSYLNDTGMPSQSSAPDLSDESFD